MKLKFPYWYLLVIPPVLFWGGALLNQIACAVNGGQMPVLYPGGHAEIYTQDAYHTSLIAKSHLKFLSDWINLKEEGMYSIGDGMVMLGDKLMDTGRILWAALMIRDSGA